LTLQKIALFTQGVYSVFVGAGTDPYEVITSAVNYLIYSIGLGDAFYTDVTILHICHYQGCKTRFRKSREKGTPPKFLILDDCWKSAEMDPNAKHSPDGNTAKG